MKCDIRKFFESIDHVKLLELLKNEVSCNKTLFLLENIVKSFRGEEGRGIPLGNLTSQLFSNIYMNLFDQFVKRELKCIHYIRYADDFLFLSCKPIDFEKILPYVRDFLSKELFLTLHGGKIGIKKWHQGIDFLGLISFPYHRILRPKTKKRLFRRINGKNLVSYLGVLSHCRSFEIRKKLVVLPQFF